MVICFFFNTCRSCFKKWVGHARWHALSPPALQLAEHDELGNPLSLPVGLGDLPLHPDKDGWYSVLGSWNGAQDDFNSADLVSEGNLEDNLPILAFAPNPPRNTSSSLPIIFCQYHKCSGNRLVIPFTQFLLFHNNIDPLLPQRSSHLRPRQIYLQGAQLFLA